MNGTISENFLEARKTEYHEAIKNRPSEGGSFVMKIKRCNPKFTFGTTE